MRLGGGAAEAAVALAHSLESTKELISALDKSWVSGNIRGSDRAEVKELQDIPYAQGIDTGAQVAPEIVAIRNILIYGRCHL